MFNTEEEARFFYSYIISDKVDTVLNITTDDIKKVLVDNVFAALVKGEEPRTVMERVNPVIGEALKNLLPD